MRARSASAVAIVAGTALLGTVACSNSDPAPAAPSSAVQTEEATVTEFPTSGTPTSIAPPSDLDGADGADGEDGADGQDGGAGGNGVDGGSGGNGGDGGDGGA